MATDGGSLLTRRRMLALGGTTVGALAFGGASFAGAQENDGDDDDDNGQAARQYRVTVANLTRGQPFTPPVVALHRPDVELFSVGDPAIEPIQEVAENGNLDPLVELAGSTNSVRAAAAGEEPLVPEEDPGDTDLPYYTELELSADASATHLSFVSMLIATNDGIVGLDTVELPDDRNESHTHYANGYDVGTEENTEEFADLVPEASSLITGDDSDGTTESDSDIAEDGVIRPHPGIEGDGDLDPDVYDWREPAALVQVERIDTDGEDTDDEDTDDEETDDEGTDGEDTDSEDQQLVFEADLSGDNEVPSVDSDASGTARVEVAEDGERISYRLQVQNIDNPAAAHIHCGGPDENGPIGITLYNNGVFTPGTAAQPDEDNECGWETLDDAVAAMRDGETYVNVHTEQNPQGEIRGQLE
ncbi:spondin domain-containing protein [Halobacterium wangiae]|uniref:spondin domain-containing protein n=1 Tax=Halobacterium wangiae TaxID=2902623 RepID=UPI001E6464DB|nr:spondin domain-containing protein [Halobacterium wangiae]